MPSFTTLTNALLLAATTPLASAYPRAPPAPRDVTSASKAGLAWPNGNGENISQYESSKVSWYYTWSPNCVDIAGSLECVPMLWGKNQVDAFKDSISNTIDSHNVKAVLGFNEPNQSGQSDLEPADAAAMWKEYMEPLKSKNVRLGSPAPSGNPNGKKWIADFLAACDGGCTVDFIAVHYYDVNATDFIRYVNEYHDLFDRPVWVTEWACQNFNGGAQCSDEDVRAFLNETQAFMDASDFVERYAWFGAFRDLQGVNDDNALMDKKGKITQLGEQFIGNQTSSGDGNGGDGNGGGVSVSAAPATASRLGAFTYMAGILAILFALQ